MSARVLVIDLETQRSIVETFSLFRPFIHIDRVIHPTRILSFAAKWRGEDKVIFKSQWEDPWNSDEAEAGYRKMMQAAWDLLNEANIVTGWNSDRFDMQWLESEFGRLKLGRPAPYKSVDLIKINKRWFRGGQMSMKLDWSARQWLRDQKTPHGATDLWHDIRYGTREEKRAAQKLMKVYNIQDTILTERMFEEYLPWMNINLAVYAQNEDGLLHCTKCNGTNLKKDGVKGYATNTGIYQMHRCKDCDATSRGKRMVTTTELRPV